MLFPNSRYPARPERAIVPRVSSGTLLLRYALARGAERRPFSFQRAADLDPSYAEAYAGIADSNNLLVFYGWSPYREGVNRAMTAAQTALGLDPRSPEAHAAMAYAQFFWKHDWDGASGILRTQFNLIQSRSRLVIGMGCTWWPPVIIPQGARTQIGLARRLNPYSRSLLIGSAYINFLGHDYDSSIAECNQVLTLYGDVMSAYTVRGLSLEQEGDFPEALVSFQKASQLQGGTSATNLAYLAHVHALMGHRVEV